MWFRKDPWSFLVSLVCYNRTMQKMATKIFIYASVAFGIVGILLILVGGPDGNNPTIWNQRLHQLLLIIVCIILPSFAISLAGRFLNK